MQRLISCILSLIVIIFVSGCSLYHIDSLDTSPYYYPPKKSTDDVIFLETVNRPHKVIGVVTVNAERRQYLSEIFIKMKREAAILGGDAITDIKSDATGNWKSLPAQELINNAYIRSNFTASVVVFK